MNSLPESHADSLVRTGGAVPGLAEEPAFALHGAEPSAIPVLIAVPHAGRAYPASLLGRLRNPREAALRLEDRHADALAARVAQATGATLLVARAPRAMIDLNRAPEDVDWGMFGGSARKERDGGSYSPGGRARSGLGLIPRRVPGIGELWKRRHEAEELQQRIAQVHEPYHAALAQALWGLRDRWGAALLIDLHSMPPLAPVAGAPAAEFVLGDRFGASCDGRLVACAFEWFARSGRLAAHNRPYAGGYVLERHAATRAGVHALQIEVDRASYLDSRLDQPSAALPALASLLAGLVMRLGHEVATLGGMRMPEELAENCTLAAE